MKLFSLFHSRGKNKRSLHLMTDSFDKCSNYMKSRENSGVKGFHEIKPAEEGERTWKKKTTTIGGNKCNTVPHINRHGGTSRNGYISKDGFQQHT